MADCVKRVRDGEPAARVIDQTGIAKSVLYRALKDEPSTWKGQARRTAPRPAPAPKPLARRPSLKAALDADGEEVEPGDPDAERALAAAGDDVAALSDLISRLQVRIDQAPPDRLGPLATSVSGVIQKRHKMRGPRVPTREELEAQAGPAAAEVVAAIREGLTGVARTEIATGRCCRCDQALPPAILEDRRAAVDR